MNIGLIGLGVMGGAYAKHLLINNFKCYGIDPDKKNISKFLKYKKKELISNFKIKIDYLELRNINNLKISSTKKNSRLFVAYYLKKIRLIDNI